jgi:hypothetical protein
MSSIKAKLKCGMLTIMVVLKSSIKDSSLGIMDVVPHFQQLANFDAYVWVVFNPQ